MSNFTQKQIQAIIDAGLEAPAVNQCEFHPYLQQKQLQEFCQRKGIQLMAYSPLGSGDSYSGLLFLRQTYSLYYAPCNKVPYVFILGTSFPEVGTGSFQSPSGGTVLIKNSVVASVASSVGKTPAQVLLRWSVQQLVFVTYTTFFPFAKLYVLDHSFFPHITMYFYCKGIRMPS